MNGFITDMFEKIERASRYLDDILARGDSATPAIKHAFLDYYTLLNGVVQFGNMRGLFIDTSVSGNRTRFTINLQGEQEIAGRDQKRVEHDPVEDRREGIAKLRSLAKKVFRFTSPRGGGGGGGSDGSSSTSSRGPNRSTEDILRARLMETETKLERKKNELKAIKDTLTAKLGKKQNELKAIKDKLKVHRDLAEGVEKQVKGILKKVSLEYSNATFKNALHELLKLSKGRVARVSNLISQELGDEDAAEEVEMAEEAARGKMTTQINNILKGIKNAHDLVVEFTEGGKDVYESIKESASDILGAAADAEAGAEAGAGGGTA